MTVHTADGQATTQDGEPAFQLHTKNSPSQVKTFPFMEGQTPRAGGVANFALDGLTVCRRRVCLPSYK